jgi:hypothetical protein
MSFRILINLILSAMDVLGLTTMKDAAICEKQYDLQNSMNHQIFERKLHLPFSGEVSMFSSASLIIAFLTLAVES